MPLVKRIKKTSAIKKTSISARKEKSAGQAKVVAKKIRSSAGPRLSKASRRALLLQAIRDARMSRERREERPEQSLRRHEDNPIIEPREHNYWEMKATFNPGAVYADKRVHLLYRAIGGDDISVLGYASSDDGVTISERLPEPAYIPKTIKKNVEEREL